MSEADKPIKLAWLGNLGNVGFNYTRLLNKRGVHATLFLNSRELDSFQPGNPEYEFKGASREPFVEIYKNNILKAAVRKLFSVYLFEKHLVKIAKQYNIIQAQTTAEVIANKLKKKFNIPYVAMTTGADLSEVAFSDSILGEKYRRALKEASHIFLVNIDQFGYLDNLGLKSVPHSFLPFNINADSFSFLDNPVKDKIIFFSVARLDWRSKNRKSIKKNDIFFRGFSEFIKQNKTDNFELWISDWGVDKEETRKLIRELGIENISKFIPPCEKEPFYGLLKSANIIIDQFHLGAVGLSAIESMAMSRPVMAYCNCDYAQRAYGEDKPPFINCRAEKEVFDNLKLISQEYIKSKSLESFEWVKRNHSEGLIARRLNLVYDGILKNN